MKLNNTITQQKFPTPPIHSKAVRESAVELLRFILAISVIVLHATSNPWISFNIAVPTFAIISGFFLVEKTNRILRSWVMLICWIIFAMSTVWILDICHLINHWNYVNFFTRYFSVSTGHFGSGWWYVYAMCFAMILAPLVNLGLKTFNKWATLIVIVGLLLLNFSYTQIEYSHFSFGTTGWFLLAYSMGGWAKLHLSKLHAKNNLLLYSCIGVAVALYFTFAILGYFNLHIWGFNASVPFQMTMVSGVCLVLICDKFKFYSKILNFLGSTCLPIYLLQVYGAAIGETFDLSWNIYLRLLMTILFTVAIAFIVTIPMNNFCKYTEIYLKKGYAWFNNRWIKQNLKSL